MRYLNLLKKMKKLLVLLLFAPFIGVSQEINIDYNGNITINNSITNSYNNQVFALVMSEGSGYLSQQYWTRSEFPQDAIKNGWDDGKSIIFINPGY